MLIYGMVLMEEVIKKLVKSTLQEKLEKYTKNKWNSFLLGIWATAVTQSSSLVSLLLLVFVWAWIIALPSAVWVIIGSNIGTTFSSMIIALLGFGKFSITAFAFPLIAIGWIGLLFIQNKKRRYYFKLFLSFWLLFFWIDLIKESVEMLKTVIDFTEYAKFWVIGFFFLWVIITAVIQSSHTVVIMTLAALHGWIITFPMALWVVIGSNIGTTVTVLFASIWWSRAKKNVAFAHLWFNCILSIIGLLYYPSITRVVTEWLGLQDNPIISLAVFNTVLHLDAKKILIDACRYTLQLFDRDLVTKEVVLTKKRVWKKRTFIENLRSIECILPILLQLEQQELTEDEHHKQESLEGVVNNCIEVMKYGKAIWEDLDALRTSSWGLEEYYIDRQNHIEQLCSKIVDILDGKLTDHDQFREFFGVEKSLYKLQRQESKHFLETISQKTAWKIPLSTLFNIERHILYIEKCLLKAWKARGKWTTQSHSGFSGLVQDLYEEGISDEKLNNE